MSQGRTKSRTMMRVKKVLPGGKTTTHYVKRKPSNSKCSVCGKVLSGVPRERPYKMQNMPKNQKRPERPFGGVLCSSCSRKKIKEEARI